MHRAVAVAAALLPDLWSDRLVAEPVVLHREGIDSTRRHRLDRRWRDQLRLGSLKHLHLAFVQSGDQGMSVSYHSTPAPTSSRLVSA